MGFAISRYWHKAPYWFENQPKELQIKLLADYRLENMEPKQLQKERRAAQVERFYLNRSKFAKGGSV